MNCHPYTPKKHRTFIISLTLGLLLTSFITQHPFLVSAAATTTTRVSISTDGTEGNGAAGDYSSWSSRTISSDGRSIVFSSSASNLVADDMNSRTDIFIRDRLTSQTTRVSVASDGTEANDASDSQTISANGRYVAFVSGATNLVPNDTNATADVFVHDMVTSQTVRASLLSGGGEGATSASNPSLSADGRYVAFVSQGSFVPGNTAQGSVYVYDMVTNQTTLASVSTDGAAMPHSARPSISADGRFVAFESDANNAVPNDTNGTLDVFIHDMQSGQTTRVSIASDGAEGNGASVAPSISSDGRVVSFTSFASNLVPNDTNNVPDIFVHDMQTGQTTRVSVASDGSQAFDWSITHAISGDGRYVAFDTASNNLVPGDSNGQGDVFIHDLQSGQTALVSVASDGTQGNNGSDKPSLTADGQFVTFASTASNLVSGDTNGTWDIFVRDRGDTGTPTPTPTNTPTNTATATGTPTPINTPVPTSTPVDVSGSIDYIALGDSVAAGHGLTLIQGGQLDYQCRRSPDKSYPAQLKGMLKSRGYNVVNFVHLACTGASAIEPDWNKLREANDYHPNKWLKNQVDDALAFLSSPLAGLNRPVLATISIGANDLPWTEAFGLCDYLSIKLDSDFIKEIQTKTSEIANAIRPQVERLLTMPNVKVIVTGYPNPFNKESFVFQAIRDSKLCNLASLKQTRDYYDRTNRIVLMLNSALNVEVVEAIRQPTRIAFVGTQIYRAFRDHESPGQGECSNTKQPTTDPNDKNHYTWIQHPDDPDSYSYPLEKVKTLAPYSNVKDFVAWRGDCFHPNITGSMKIAEIVNSEAKKIGR